MKIPKSVPESKKYVIWAFPALLAYGAFLLTRAGGVGRCGVALAMLVVFTGWSSFAIINEHIYNDLLLVIDLALLSQYVALLTYLAQIDAARLSGKDVAAWAVSASIFALYAAWDFAALIASNTRHMATANHLKRFGWICTGIAILCTVGAYVTSTIVAGSNRPDAKSWIQWGLLGLWLGVIIWWHGGRVWAAVKGDE